MKSYSKFAIGQVIEPDAPRGIFHEGQSRWYGLVIHIQREDQAERWLELRGVYAFHPVRVRHKRIKGNNRRIVSRYLPGYVFARFPGEIIPHRVVGTPFIRGMIRLENGQPAILEPQDLRALHAMRDVDDETRKAEAERSKIRKGDKVRLLTGVMSGQEVEVLELKAGRAKFRIRMFGGEVPAEAMTTELQKVNP